MKTKTKTTKTFFKLLLVLGLILLINASFLIDNSHYAIVTETEKSLELKDWMLNENYFNTSIILETETEESLELKDWMKDDTLFNPEKEEKVEKKGKENFGTGYKKTNFGRRVFIMYEEEEIPLKVENWMLDEKYFQ